MAIIGVVKFVPKTEIAKETLVVKCATNQAGLNSLATVFISNNPKTGHLNSGKDIQAWNDLIHSQPATEPGQK